MEFSTYYSAEIQYVQVCRRTLSLINVRLFPNGTEPH